MPHDEDKKLKVISERIAAFDYICKPVCEMSKYACMLVNENFLTTNQVKILEKMGFEVVCVAVTETEKQNQEEE